jgi:hypothetical protein
MPPHHFQNRATSTGRDRTRPRCIVKTHDHIARIWPDRGVDCHSVADCCAYRLLRSAFQVMAGRCHDGIHDTHRGRNGGHRFIGLSAWLSTNSCATERLSVDAFPFLRAADDAVEFAVSQIVQLFSDWRIGIKSSARLGHELARHTRRHDSGGGRFGSIARRTRRRPHSLHVRRGLIGSDTCSVRIGEGSARSEQQ